MMPHSLSVFCNLLGLMTLCYLLTLGPQVTNGQAYHFSKGWMPGKRTFSSLYNLDSDDSHIQDKTARADMDPDPENMDLFTGLRILDAVNEADREAESGRVGMETSVEQDDTGRLRTLLRTLPRLQGRLPHRDDPRHGPRPEHETSPPQPHSQRCHIRPHLTRLIHILLDVSTISFSQFFYRRESLTTSKSSCLKMNHCPSKFLQTANTEKRNETRDFQHKGSFWQTCSN